MKRRAGHDTETRAGLRSDAQRNRGGRRTHGSRVLTVLARRFRAVQGRKRLETGPLTAGPNQQSTVFQRCSEVGIMEQPTATGWSNSCRAGFAPARTQRLSTAHASYHPGGDIPKIEVLQALLASNSDYEDREITRFPQPLSAVDSIINDIQKRPVRTMFQAAISQESIRNLEDMSRRLGNPEVRSPELKTFVKRLRKFALRTSLATIKDRVQRLVFENDKLRQVSPQSQNGNRLDADGSSLPWVVRDLKRNSQQRCADWIDHVRLVLPELKDLRVGVRADENSAYLILCYGTGFEVPS